MYPTSAVMNTRSLRFWKSAMIVRTNSSRIASRYYGAGMRKRQLVESLLVLSVVHRQVVGSHGIFHVPNAVTLDGVGNDDNWSAPIFQSPCAAVTRRQQGG